MGNFLYQTSGYEQANTLGDRLEDDDPTSRYFREVDPAQLLEPFSVPGLPIAQNNRGGFRGRPGNEATIKPHYVSKGELPL